MRIPMPDGRIGHAELKIGDSILMLASGGAEWPGTSSLTCLYVEDCDAVFTRAVEAGATVIEPLADKFYGDRAGSIEDPFGQRWSIMTHKEDLTPEEMEARMPSRAGPEPPPRTKPHPPDRRGWKGGAMWHQSKVS
jgi:PhnB protein